MAQKFGETQLGSSFLFYGATSNVEWGRGRLSPSLRAFEAQVELEPVIHLFG
jgi:hypothetical protein